MDTEQKSATCQILNTPIVAWQEYSPRSVFEQWHFFLLAPFYYLRRFIKQDNFLRTMNINNHLNETNVAISLRVSITNHLKLVRIYLRNPVVIIYRSLGMSTLAFSLHPPLTPLTTSKILRENTVLQKKL